MDYTEKDRQTLLMIPVPCMPGDSLFYIIPGTPGSTTDPPYIYEDICTDVSTKLIFGKDAQYNKSELGVDLFLTREDAQTAFDQRYPSQT